MDTEKDIKDRLDDHQKAYIHFLSDVLEDRKRDSNFLKGIIVCLSTIIAVLVISIVGLGIYHQNKLAEVTDRSERRMYEFISNYDFANSIDIDTGTITDSDGSGYVNFTGR